MAGLIETVAAPPYNGKADLPDIARTLQLAIDDLFPVAELLHHLGFAEIKGATFCRSPPRAILPISTR
jgi:NitT/TauT family transport system ATP-binding protein